MQARLKLCGITRAGDAELAASLGADLIGLILAPQSVRCLDRERALSVRRAIGANTLVVGVFADQEIDFVNETAKYLSLDYVQLHGNEQPDYCRQIELPVIKALDLTSPDLEADCTAYADVAAYILLDLPKAGGRRELVQADRERIASLKTTLPLFVAGGISIANARSTIEWCRPFALDACSSIEHEPGIKNFDTMRQLCAIVQGVQR